MSKSDQPLIRFDDVTFFWPPEDAEAVKRGEVSLEPVFAHFSAELPGGVVSLVGPNGSGKSTFMLLAGGRILPQRGQVLLAGTDTRELVDAEAGERRNRLCSFIYQNMEFEDEGEAAEPLGAVLEFVTSQAAAEGIDPAGSERRLRNTTDALELRGLLNRRLANLSKGELQRALVAMSILYGSKCIMMDEPCFAMEGRHKEATLDLVRSLYSETGCSVYVSLHEQDLTRKFADTVMLFYPDRRIDLGAPEEVLTTQALEDAYGVPAAMLHDSEQLQRSVLLESALCEKK